MSSVRALIEATTSAATSKPFRVNPNESLSFKAWGLATDETVTLQVDRGDGEFQDVADAVLTATAYQQRIISGGLYRMVKTETAGLSGASVG